MLGDWIPVMAVHLHPAMLAFSPVQTLWLIPGFVLRESSVSLRFCSVNQESSYQLLSTACEGEELTCISLGLSPWEGTGRSEINQSWLPFEPLGSKSKAAHQSTQLLLMQGI